MSRTWSGDYELRDCCDTYPHLEGESLEVNCKVTEDSDDSQGRVSWFWLRDGDVEICFYCSDAPPGTAAAMKGTNIPVRTLIKHGLFPEWIQKSIEDWVDEQLKEYRPE
jgi:hypothetical protein